MKEKPLTPLRAIRLNCLDCLSRPKDVRECQSTDCVFHKYRMGKNPARKGIGGKAKPLLKLAKRTTTGANHPEEGNDMTLGFPVAKSANKEEITSAGKGSFEIEKTGKEFIIRLTQE